MGVVVKLLGGGAWEGSGCGYNRAIPEMLGVMELLYLDCAGGYMIKHTHTLYK